MYIPAAFEQSDVPTLWQFIEQHSFGLLVSSCNGEPFASHLPFLLDQSMGPHGSLIGHMALANPQWKQAEGQSVLAVFSGPHAYISPTWYESENVVPTWNYVAVHAYGTFHVLKEEESLAKLLEDFVSYYEASQPEPWQFDAAGNYSRKMMKAVTGFRIELTRIEGKWKLNQNRPRDQREKVARKLHDLSDPDARNVAKLMRNDLEAPR